MQGKSLTKKLPR